LGSANSTFTVSDTQSPTITPTDTPTETETPTATNTGSPTAIPRAPHKAAVRNAFVITLLHNNIILNRGDNRHNETTIPASLKNMRCEDSGSHFTVARKNNGIVVAPQKPIAHAHGPAPRGWDCCQ
jgi:hypothetical protein